MLALQHQGHLNMTFYQYLQTFSHCAYYFAFWLTIFNLIYIYLWHIFHFILYLCTFYLFYFVFMYILFILFSISVHFTLLFCSI